MALSSGSNLGPYQILEPLGRGGMGEVYRARDNKLGRDVAIKVLPEDHARDADRLARFQREAQVLASLNHPNVGAIYDLQKHGNTNFLILELVEGETLAERISRAAIPADEAVEIARQIAEALSAAHEKGIVHRDLKPANVKITPAGSVKVLDFGLAKFFETASAEMSLSQSPTVAMSVRTEESVILGTVPYMSPEQARGRPVTKQTDIWALGCVLFEMLTQRQVYSGETVSDTIAKILKEEPDWKAAKAAAPLPLQRIMERCLQKDARRRFHDAADVRLELEEALVPAPLSPTPRSKPRRSFAIAALTLASLLLGIAGGFWYQRADPQERDWTGTLLSGPSSAYSPRVSPDGKMLAFLTLIDGQSQVAVMNPLSGNWTVLTHGKEQPGPQSLNWSADGTRIYFDRMEGGPRGVFSVPALGGEPRLILEDACSPIPLPDGSIVVIRLNADRAGQLYRFKPDTSDLQPLNAVLQNIYGAPVRAFPDGRELVFYGKPADLASTSALRLHILDLQPGETRPIGPDFPSGFTSSGIGGLGLAVNPIDRSVLVDMRDGDLHQVVSVPYDGKGTSRVLLTLTQESWGMDMTTDGTLFVDQVSRPVEIVRFRESDTAPTPIAVVHGGMPSALELPDRGVLITTSFNGRSRLSVVKPDKEIVPFVDTPDETREPLAFAGPHQVAFVVGTEPRESIGIASIKDGRLLRRLNVEASDGIKSLAASNDGATLFYSSGGAIWSIPATGGNATRLGAGDAVSYDPSRQDLVVYFFEQTVRLVRMPATGGATEPLELPDGARIESLVGPASIRRDGQIVVSVVSRGSWFLAAAIFDPRSRTLRRIPLRYDADLFSMSWNQKNEIVTGAFLWRANIWRFQLQDAASR
ncbi:MAG TPA: protein kinase [Terriglobia bacterium]|nr:protein kinase [Terriglobia bacterium]